jgi:hypothetical protein
METINKFPKYLIDSGLIFEINRKVLHPLGLAMVVDIDRNNKRQLAITALFITDDKEGFLYDEEGYNIGKESYQKFLNKGGQERLDYRLAKYGFVEQDKSDVK